MATYGGSAPIFGRHSVASEKTTVVTRRVAQYIVDVIANGVLSAIPFLLLVAASTDSAGNVEGGTATSVLYAIAIVLALAVSVWYWVLRPAAHRGRTFGMALMRIRVVDADTAGEARKGQLVIRWILLIVDTLFAGLVGLITMLVSKRHQRVGDMGAHTLVVRDRGPRVY
ncbi:RDD family protein [Embleya sp. NBC_00896]|uniref:RDD family protein n=1 Tax=Embleya sp. NBC_00896 TaxID=2975961 RepID=UPI002F9166BE|nr:RDD family protein [Embleya sp. NBC_00896]